MLAVPASTGIAVLADPIVRALLGPNWLDAIPLLQIMSLYGLIKLGGGNASSVLLAVGRPKVITFFAVLNLALLLPSLIVGITLAGLAGAAWALVATAALNLLLSYVVVIRHLHISLLLLGKAIWRCWLSAAIMAAIVSAALSLSAAWLDNPWAQLGAGIVLGAAVYPLTLLALWWIAGRPHGAEQMALSALARMRGSALATGPA
jgi:O-antigen/teichoic acid export membrane protein